MRAAAASEDVFARDVTGLQLQFRQDLADASMPSGGKQILQGIEPIARLGRVDGMRFDVRVICHFRWLVKLL